MDAGLMELKAKFGVLIIKRTRARFDNDETAVMAVDSWCIGFALNLHDAANSSIGHLANTKKLESRKPAMTSPNQTLGYIRLAKSVETLAGNAFPIELADAGATAYLK